MLIYSLSCPISKEVRYIGFTSRKVLNKRYFEHLRKSILSIKTKKNNWIKSLLNKGLYPIIEIVEEVRKENWQDSERYWIAQFKAWGFNLCNSTDGGEGTLGHKLKKESIIKGVLSRKENGKPWHSNETIAKMKVAQLGKPKSKEAKIKLSKTITGRKMKYARKKGRNITMYTKDLVPIESFTAIILASEKTGILSTSIHSNLTNRSKSAGGYVWKYDDEGNRKRV